MFLFVGVCDVCMCVCCVWVWVGSEITSRHPTNGVVYVLDYNAEQVFDMTVVYLPYGYPVQSGQPYENVVYQGNICRVYDVPIDPRTNEQLFQRRFLADTSKVRTTLDVFGKAAARTVFGTKWATVVYQLIKADEDGRWTEAEDAWNGFTVGEQNAWRVVAPYLATFNDPGKMFYCYARALAQYLYDFSGITWKASIWGASDSASAAAWWTLDMNAAMGVGIYDDPNSQFVYVGGWHVNGYVGAYGGAVHDNDSAGTQSCDFYFNGSYIELMYLKFTSYGNAKIYLDGVLKGTINQFNSTLLTGLFNTYAGDFKGLHFVKVIADASLINVDRVLVN